MIQELLHGKTINAYDRAVDKCGFISALENLDYKTDEIWRVTAEMKELFNWLSVDEAKAYYNGSPY